MDIKKLPPLEEFTHRMPVQLRFTDIDILGHVNNTVYLSFYDTGKARYFEAINGGKVDWQRVETVIANVDVAFVESVLFGEEIEVLTRCAWVHDKSFMLQQVIVGRKTGALKSAAETVMVSIDPSTHTSRPVPEDMRKRLEGESWEGK